MKSLLLAAALVALSIPASASEVWTATPAQSSSQVGFVAGAVIWSCGSEGCRTTSDTTIADSLTACRALASQLGRITSFAIDGRVYSSRRLASCNAAAKPLQPRPVAKVGGR